MRTNYQIIQLNTKMEQLIELFTAQPSCHRGVSAPKNPSDDFDANQGLDKLGALAQIKALSISIESSQLTDRSTSAQALGFGGVANAVGSAQIPRSRVTVLDHELPPSPLRDQRAEAILHNESIAPDDRVWVEWKYIPLHPAARSSSSSTITTTNNNNNNSNTNSDAIIEHRMNALALLLKETHYSEQLRYPRCSGYIREPYTNGHREGIRFGLVFHKPAGVAPTTRPVSLLDLLNAAPSPQAPSMTARVALIVSLAECLERFHAVGWLHKSLRSSNIIFFPDRDDAGGQVDLTRPYVSGFDYARPSKEAHYTEVLVRNAAHDLYRHPHVQGSGREADSSYAGFKRGYDMYSLGVVLLEVARWEPISRVVGLPEEKAATLSDTMAVKAKLLDVPLLQDLAARVGDRIARAIEACLTSLSGLGLEGGPTQRDAEVDARIQLAFYEKVVRELNGVMI